MTLSYYLGL